MKCEDCGTEDPGAPSYKPACLIERDMLRAEVAELQALEMNHDGACVRLKRERDEARIALKALVDYFDTAEWRMVDAHEWLPLRDAAMNALSPFGVGVPRFNSEKAR